MSYTRIVAVVAFGVLSALSGAVWSQAYPAHPVRLLVPAAVGGTTDLLVRALSGKLGDNLGQPIIVENKAGSTTSIAEEYVVRSAPDGYTLLMSSITLATQTMVRANLSYDPQRDLVPISLVATSGNVIVVNPQLPVKTVKELIQLAKSSSTPLYYGTPVYGATGHLAGEMFNQMAGVKLVQVAYKGAAPALQDLIAGQIQLTFDNIPAAINYIRSGRIRAIAVTASKRDRQMPDIPTVAESGLPGYDIVAWFGMVGPAKLPAPIIAKLNGDVVKSLKDPAVLERMERLGFDAVGSTPEEFRAYIKAEAEKLGRVIRNAGMKPE